MPTGPGVYRMRDAAGNVVYVGKAKNLRRRLSQYRNAKRRKKHLKMRAIVKSAARVEIEPCATELEAELLEARLIQELRPKWNVAGAFSFLYPMIGLGESRTGDTILAFSTQPEERPELEWYGAFRSREITGEAFFALVRLLERVGHRVPGPARARGTRTYAFMLRRIPRVWRDRWAAFMRGEARDALETLVLRLLESPGARRDATKVQEDIDALERFHRHEAVRLRVARERTGHEGALVPQALRDSLFIRARAVRARGASAAPAPSREAAGF